MAIVIRDTTVVTGDAARTVRHGASIVVDADRIAAVGPVEEVDRRYPDATRVDGRGKAVFPGLVDCHTHLWFTVARGIQENNPRRPAPAPGARAPHRLVVDPQRPGR
jgi:5-methylthioadenosine/S-adenosylhomocysteine deaminase